MRIIENLSVLLTRLIICVWFVPDGVSKIFRYDQNLHLMASHYVPAFLLPIAIFIEIVGGALVLLGWKAKSIALIMAIYTVIVNLWIHLPLPAHNPVAYIIIMAELVDAGAFLMLFVHGAGEWSLDKLLNNRNADK